MGRAWRQIPEADWITILGKLSLSIRERLHLTKLNEVMLEIGLWPAYAHTWLLVGSAGLCGKENIHATG